MAQIELGEEVQDWVGKLRTQFSAKDKTDIHELNKVVKPLYNECVIPYVNSVNTALGKELGENVAPRLNVISNVDLNQTDLNRNFIQIVFQDVNTEFNPLTNPYLLIEGDPSGKMSFISSSFQQVEKLDEIENIYKAQSSEELNSKFISAFKKFIAQI